MYETICIYFVDFLKNCVVFLYSGLVWEYTNLFEKVVILNCLWSSYTNLCDWFVDNKLSIHFGEDKTKTILFGSKYKIKKAGPLNIYYEDISIKQHDKVTYLGCILDKTLSGESMALHVINKINARLKFLYRQRKFLTKPLRDRKSVV